MPDSTSPTPSRPMVFVALAYVAGLLMAGLWMPPSWLLWLVMGLSVVWAGREMMLAAHVHGPLPPSGAVLLAAVVALGWWRGCELNRHDNQASEQAQALAGRVVEAWGRVSGQPRWRQDSVGLTLTRVTLRPGPGSSGGQDTPVTLNLGLDLTLGEQAFKTALAQPETVPREGQWVHVTGKLYAAADATRPTPTDRETMARGRGVCGRIFTARADAVELETGPADPGARVQRGLTRLREGIGRQLEIKLPPQAAALARALLLGEAQLLPQEVRRSFRLSGLAHLLAVSGLHTGFVLLIVLGLAHLTGMGPRASAWVGIAALAAYAILTGLRPPVARAALMGIFILWGYATGRTTTQLAALATAAFATLAWDARNLLRLDWQLSYVAVGSILLMATPLYEWMLRGLLSSKLHGPFNEDGGELTLNGWRWWVGRLLLMPLAVTLAVQLGMIPLQLCYFQQLSLWAPVSNVAGGYLTLVAMIGSMLTAAVGWVPGLGTAVAWASGIALNGLAGLSAAVESSGWGRLTLPPMPWWMIGAYYACLLSGAWVRCELHPRVSRRQRSARGDWGTAGRVLAAGAFLIWLPLTAPGPNQGELDVYMVDVGQGDALVLRMPNGKIMVVDTGGIRPDQGEYTLTPFLQTLGVSRIDCLVLTHADADHIGGAAALLRNFEVALLLTNGEQETSQTFAELQREIQSHAVREVHPAPGDRLEGMGEVQVRLLGPLAEDGNEASLVLSVTYGEVDLLLMGDLEQEGEKQLVASGAVGPVEVLKAGHHGSDSSSARVFLQAVQPRLSLVSAGRNNRYGHPSPAVLDRLQQAGSAIARTDQQGTLWLHCTRHTIDTYRYAGAQ